VNILMEYDYCMPKMYPVHLIVTGRKCVVIGGGKVAERKVKMLLECGADILVISPNLCPELQLLKNKGLIKVIDRQYRNGDLKKAYIAIAATGSTDINHLVATAARANHVLVNTVDDPLNSDFYVPSFLRRGNITISISTSGMSPALARKIKTKLEKELGEEYGTLLNIICEIRGDLKSSGITVDAATWQQSLDLHQLTTLIKEGKHDEVRHLITGILMGGRDNS
jgi:precorrin-2 dehydrogenase / sirohydrochlorin ferrochelatase